MQRAFITRKELVKQARKRLARARKRFIKQGAGKGGLYNIAYHTALAYRQSLHNDTDRARIATARDAFLATNPR